jgi:murein DD-endopeptidase MepM/ murein hydrolase activator NlpD
MAKGGGIGLADLIAGQLGADKPTANSSAIERVVETARSLRDPATATATGEINPSADDSLDALEQLQAMTRPRRVADLVREELSAQVSAVKLPSSPDVAAIKQAFVEPPSSLPQTSPVIEPANESPVQTDANIEELQAVTRPRRVTETADVALPAGVSAVKLPAPTESEIIKRTFIESPAAVSRASYTGRPQVDAIIEQAARRHGVDPNLVAAVMRTESAVRQNAVSHKGASGYMQLMPATFRQFAGPGKNIFDPVENINAGVAYLKSLSNRYRGSLDKILAGYNAGEGNVDKFGGIPPFKETRNFVATVKSRYRELLASAKPSSSETVAIGYQPRFQTDGVKYALPPRLGPVKPGNIRDTITALKGLGERTRITVPRGKAEFTTEGEVELQIPVQGRISSAFGARRPRGVHKGVDIAVPRGTPIEASAGGEVVFAGWRSGYGNTVVIKHQDGLLTRYAHADKILVSRGDSVQSGQQVATVGSTGKSTGPHLHFEVMRAGQRVNPLRAVADSADRRMAIK